MINSSLYNYYLPKSFIAQKPSTPRDFSRLFVYETKTDQIYFDRFLNIDRYLPQKSFLVLNNTKVMPARVSLRKETGGLVKILFFINEVNELTSLRVIRGMVDRKINVGEKLFFNEKYFLDVIKQEEKIFYFKLNFSYQKFLELLEEHGEMPIPLYLRKTPLKKNDLFKKYQTIFAQKQGSIAAPTASLHFTNRVFEKLEKRGIKKYFITLHVGLGTFAPITKENLKLKKLHEEYYEVEQSMWNKIVKKRNNGKKLVAVGTTVTRTLETFAKSKIKNQKSKFFFEKTDLFIFPPFNFQMVDILITNFHLPKSSLMMLIEAFLQHKKSKRHLVDLYNIAIKNNFRFYSFGDCMLIK